MKAATETILMVGLIVSICAVSVIALEYGWHQPFPVPENTRVFNYRANTGSPLISHSNITCVFKGATKAEECFEATRRWSCKGRESCSVRIGGIWNQRFRFRSTCAKAYDVAVRMPTTTISFDCSKTMTATGSRLGRD